MTTKLSPTDLEQIKRYAREKIAKATQLWWAMLFSLVLDMLILTNQLNLLQGKLSLLWFCCIPVLVSFMLDRPLVKTIIVDSYIKLRKHFLKRTTIIMWVLIILFATTCIGISFRAIQTNNTAQLIFSIIFFLGTFSSIWNVLRNKTAPAINMKNLDILISIQTYLVLMILQIFAARLCSLAGAAMADHTPMGSVFYYMSLALTIFLLRESKPTLKQIWQLCPRCTQEYPINYFTQRHCIFCLESSFRSTEK